MPKKCTNVFRRKDGRWEARYIKAISQDGKKIYGSVYGTSFQEAKEKQLYFLMNPNKKADNNPYILKDIMFEWLKSIDKSIKQSTFQKYEAILHNHIEKHFISQIEVEYIDTNLISSFTNSLIDSGKLSPKTINDILTVLGMVLKYSNANYRINTPKIKYIREERKEMRVLTIDEQIILEQYLRSNINNYKLGIIIALYTGIRIGELCALEWADIKNGNISINKSVQRIKHNGKTAVIISSPKTKKSNRIIPIPDFLKSLLEINRSQGTVLKNRNGNLVEPRLMQLTFEKYIEECGLPKTNFHALRHTFATRCVEAGFDIKSLSEILGHSNVNTTLNLYVHSSLKQKEKNMALLKPAINL